MSWWWLVVPAGLLAGLAPVLWGNYRPRRYRFEQRWRANIRWLWVLWSTRWMR